MTRYTTIPQTVEAMQWLGPDDPAHVAAFEAWACGDELAGTYRAVTHLGLSVLRSENWIMELSVGIFVVREDGRFESYSAEDFHARYTPTPDVEGVP